MPVHVSIAVHKEVADIDQANDFVDELVELLQGNVTAKLESNITNRNPIIELTREQESE